MDDPVVAGLKAALSIDNVWLERSTIAVVVGVTVELIDLLVFNKEMGRLQRGILLFATILVVLGCAGEWVFEHDAAQKEGRLQQLSDERVGALALAEATDKKTATQAAEAAGRLGVDVKNVRGFAQKQAALVTAGETEIKSRTQAFQVFALSAKSQADATIDRMNKDRADLDSARNEAQAAANGARQELAIMAEANRHRGDLTDAQKQAIVARLAPFAGRRVDILTFGDTDEIASFGRILAELFTSARWKPKIWSTFNGSMFGVHGVPVFARTVDAGAPAQALVNALQAQQISAAQLAPAQVGDWTAVPSGGINGPNWDAKDIADVRVLVGVKP